MSRISTSLACAVFLAAVCTFLADASQDELPAGIQHGVHPLRRLQQGACTQVSNTLLYYGEDSLTHSKVDSAETCCTRCRNTPGCNLWNFCPTNAGSKGCYTTQYSFTVYSEAGYCNLYTVGEGKQPSVDQVGPETTWVSGYPPGPSFNVPSPPANSSGTCTQVPNILLYYGERSSYSKVDSSSECCAHCRNDPRCTLWTWCPSSQKEDCYSTQYSFVVMTSPGHCSLFTMPLGKQPSTDQQGPQTPWISGFKPGFEPAGGGQAPAASPAPSPASASSPAPSTPAPTSGAGAISPAPAASSPAPAPATSPATVPPSSPAGQAPSTASGGGAGGCSLVPNTLQYYGDRTSYSKVGSAAECCTRCRNTPGCSLFAFCPESTGQDGCYTTQYSFTVNSDTGSCNLFTLPSDRQPSVDQHGAETPWVSGRP